jgi:hypothetical protein
MRRSSNLWRERVFLVLAGIVIGMVARSLFPPAKPEFTDLRKVNIPAAEKLRDVSK